MDGWNWESLLRAEAPARPAAPTLDDLVAAVLAVRTHDTVTQGEQVAHRWQGALRVPADDALDHLTPRFAERDFTALVQEADEPGEVVVLAVPGVLRPASSRLWLALLLFALTVGSTFITGALEAGPGGGVAIDWANGLMYSGAIMAILLAHELGHFIASRRLGVAVSYPFFIPLPVASPFGTMGAFIQMKEPPPDRRALFTIGVAGPLAGLVLAIPLTLLGLYLSPVQPLPDGAYYLEGNNILYGAMKWLVHGRWLPSNGEDVFLHPIAWAGWSGLFVTMLNLLPAGQLDGGHVVFALLGRRRAQWVTYGVIGGLALLGFVWSGWWLWAVLIFFLANRHAPILNDVTALSPRQRWVAVVTILLFLLLFMPTPLTVVGVP